MLSALLLSAQQQIRLPPLLLSIDGTDRQTDARQMMPVRRANDE